MAGELATAVGSKRHDVNFGGRAVAHPLSPQWFRPRIGPLVHNCTIRLSAAEGNGPKRKGQLVAALFLFRFYGTARGQTGVSVLLGGGATDAHVVERTVDEDKGDDEEDGGEYVRQAAALAGGELHG